MQTRLAAAAAGVVAAAAGAPLLVPVDGVRDAVAAGGACAVALLAVRHARRVALLAGDLARFADRVAAGEYGDRVEVPAPDELRGLAESVNGLAARVAREGHSRANFIGKVSHELRTPLTVIKGYVYTLQRTEDDAARAAKLDVINSECERLAYLVEDLLELSRAQAGELRISAALFPLQSCVEEVTQRLHGPAAQQDVGLELEWEAGDARVMADENRVRQILVNLITNGIKYAPPGTAVRVSGAVRGDRVEVAVADAGRGISPGDLPHIFDEFFQGSDGAEPGAGLGLAIARELALAHGGGIDVESSPGAGATFVVWLPVWRESA